MQPKETQPDSRARLRGSKLFRYFTLGLCGSTCGTILLASPATAQLNRSTSGGTCFMVTSSGKQLNLGSLCGEENVPAPTISKSSVVRLKIKKRYASTPVVNVAFNGKTFEMIFDTGASSTLITQGMANALNIQPTGYREVIIADGSTVKMPVTSIKQISAGGLTNRNIEVTIANKADVGLLGHDFFGNYDIKIKRNEIELHPQK
ncbi:retroviral-like aspartic protease family protein [filamentous cyanobacterium LEGE 11480]|uniref:Retroviral-like aspartic protease family protein n=1 Tax=Romeriopsis navalis LEGE 11480 TaxID=2777977 RepID=A0A928VQ10_9CYAN|nr:retropepsin-like aspartic protease [Romeriopsis navalis]MBE9030806.1 retroviral-like aspartic protease family protein [Romeriopsis navalis LEGE 11480]